MSYEKLEQLYEGKAKKIFATSDPNVVIVSYKDDATAFNGLKKGTITGKGAVVGATPQQAQSELYPVVGGIFIGQLGAAHCG